MCLIVFYFGFLLHGIYYATNTRTHTHACVYCYINVFALILLHFSFDSTFNCILLLFLLLLLLLLLLVFYCFCVQFCVCGCAPKQPKWSSIAIELSAILVSCAYVCVCLYVHLLMCVVVGCDLFDSMNLD